jgi:5-hydroxyisourate hydrolase-like protein (transthyretin family)
MFRTCLLRIGLILPAVLAVCSAGCSKDGDIAVHPVHGQVLLDGKPLAQAIVTFHAQAGSAHKLSPSAQTDAEGRFELTSFQTGDGAPEGTYAVTLTCFRAAAGRKVSEGDESARNVVPVRYANPATSKLTAVVKPGENELEPFKVSAR